MKENELFGEEAPTMSSLDMPQEPLHTFSEWQPTDEPDPDFLHEIVQQEIARVDHEVGDAIMGILPNEHR